VDGICLAPLPYYQINNPTPVPIAAVQGRNQKPWSVPDCFTEQLPVAEINRVPSLYEYEAIKMGANL
jgi:hypothetical protein